MRSLLGMRSWMNSSWISSIKAFTTPEASVAGMSQCSQPCVCEIMEMELPVPPTGKPPLPKASMSGATCDWEATMNSTLLREVKRIKPSA